MQKLEAELTKAGEVYAEAIAKAQNVATRQAAALAAHAAAVEGREKLVATAAGGYDVAPKALTAANLALALAGDERKLWEDAAAGAASAVAAADVTVQAVRRQIADLRFAIACKERIKKTEALQAAANEFNRCYQAYRQTEHEMGAAYNDLNQPFAPGQLETLRAWREATDVIAPDIREIIAQRKSAHGTIDLVQHEIYTWGGYAAQADAISPTEKA